MSAPDDPRDVALPTVFNLVERAFSEAITQEDVERELDALAQRTGHPDRQELSDEFNGLLNAEIKRLAFLDQ